MLATNRQKRREALSGYMFVAPAILLLLIFSFVPIVFSGYVSFFKFPLVNPARRSFIGFDNYVKLFSDEVFLKAFANTAYYALMQVPLQTGFGLALALLIKKRTRLSGMFRSIYYMPVVISMVVASSLWRIMLDSQFGLINSIITWMGFARQPFLTSVTQAMPALAVMLSWKWSGFSMLIFLAGLNNIPGELYEAARIDGANSWQMFWRVTIPLLRRPAGFVVVSNTINAFKLFTPIYIITQGGPQNATLSVIYHIFREGFLNGWLGYASTMANVFTLFLMILALVQLKVLRSSDEG
jgi:fructooligosaccharide transport system permease protein